MDLDAIREKALEMMGKRRSHPNREPGYIYFHGQRVGSIALQLRKLIFPGKQEHDQVILVGSWFHDLAKGLEPHWEYGTLLASRILHSFCPSEQLSLILEIIECHTLRKERQYPFYVRLVQDADLLDHFGSQEVWLNFYHSACTGAGTAASLAYFEGRYGKQARKLRKLLNFEESVHFFDEKDQFVREFAERFRQEAEGRLMEKQKKTKRAAFQSFPGEEN